MLPPPVPVVENPMQAADQNNGRPNLYNADIHKAVAQSQRGQGL